MHINFKILTCLVVVVTCLSFTTPAHATVGGPTTIYDFKFSPHDASVYFTLRADSGRGCRPLLYKISLDTLTTSQVLSCDVVEEMNVTDPNASNLEIEAITSGLKSLTPISLTKNNISIDIRHDRTEKIEGDNWVLRNHFKASVFQNGTKISEVPLTGCTTEQPFTILGYAIPTLTTRIALLVSTKSDCFEGGYTGESLHIVNDVKIIDRTSSNFYKSHDALVPSETTLIVYPKIRTEAPPSITPPPSQPPQPETQHTSNPSKGIMVLIAATCLIVGAALGSMTKK